MIDKNDKILELRLYTPHNADYICERPDGTRYVYEVRKTNKRYYDLNTDIDLNK